MVTADEARTIYRKHPKLFIAIKHQLNRLEGLSAAYLNGVVDTKMFEASYKNGIKIWYRRYREAIPVFENDCGCTWEPFKELGKIWEKEIPIHTPPEVENLAAPCARVTSSSAVE